MAIDYSKWIYANTATPYMDSYKKYATAETARANDEIAGIEGRQTADLNSSSAQYDNTARQNYINFMQAQRRLPSQLNALGIRGGASESSAIRLNTNYGSNVASNEAARNDAAEKIRQAYAQQIADRRNELNATLASAEQAARDKQVEYEQTQMQRDLEQFSSVIEGLYTSRSSYKKLIAALKKSKDPNKKMKIMLATRAMNQLEGSGGGGGGGRRGGGRSYGYGYGGSSGSGGGGDDKPKSSGATDRARTAASGRGSGYGKTYTYPKKATRGHRGHRRWGSRFSFR